MCLYLFFFFFQAEDGIRDADVTGVQTCALPISTRRMMREVCGTASRIGAAMETQQLNVLYGIAQAISAAEFRARTVLAGVCSTVADAFAFERVAIFRYLEDIDSIVPFAAHGGAA